MSRGQSRGSRAKSGSHLSDRQIAFAVRDGRPITAIYPAQPASNVHGWVCGMDAYHWQVVDLDGAEYLLHKGSTPILRISGDRLDDLSGTAVESVRKRTAPFRSWVLREFFQQAGPDDQPTDRQSL